MREFLDLGDPDFERIAGLVRASYPKSCICWIERVHNPELMRAFLARKAFVDNEQALFHGTAEEAVDSIVEIGFDPKRNKASAYGKGTYFAKHASYSFNYMKGKEEITFMFLCRVLVGRTCKGSGGLVIDTSKYDSACDHPAHPTIVVTPYADAAYPEYIISFHKNAR